MGRERASDAARLGRLVVFGPGITEIGGAARRTRLLLEELGRRWEIRGVLRAGTLSRFRVHRIGNGIVVEVPGFRNRVLGGALYLTLAIPLGIWWSRKARGLLAIQLLSQATAAALSALSARRPFLAFMTTSGSTNELSHLFASKIWMLRRRLLNRAAALVAQNDAAASQLRDAFDAPVVVVPNPVELTDVAVLTGRPNVLFAGRFSEEKDLLTLLEAWRVVLEEVPSARLILAGSGGHYRSVEPAMREMVSSDVHLAASVEMPGWVPDMTSLLGECDVFVLPSRSEGMSNALLEACAHGRVVVASSIPANCEVVGDDYPLLFPVSDAARCARALVDALTDDSLRRDAAVRARRAAERFDVHHVVPRIERLIEDVARRARN